LNTYFEGRGSDSPYIEAVWRGGAGKAYAPVCPASSQWHLLFLKQHDTLKIAVQGPLTRATPVAQPEGTEWLGVTFPLGTFLPVLSIKNVLDEQAVLPLTAKTSFHLAGSSWHVPDFENVETFIERLARQNALVSDPVVKAVLAQQPVEMSLRTVRRRFVLATGLPYQTIAQIERAKQAAALLEQGVSLIDAAYQSGYADQSHMTRALKHFIGYTPALIARAGNEEMLR
jgi:AraC-like DNA-binding protein